MSRLLKERNVARFIVAPDGYGKTSLAIDYAETLFSWVHVFFVNGQSPCFIRDLDNGILAARCFEVDEDARLVIFDDLPVLDPQRAAKLSVEIDALLSRSCEVMVACTPMCDVYGHLQRDRLNIGARELLLSDEELDVARSSDERRRVPSSRLPASKRVPGLVWAEKKDAVQSFVRQMLKEQLPADVLLAVVGMTVLHRGQLADVSRFGSLSCEKEVGLFDSYPHLGCDFDAGTFETPFVSIDDLAIAVRKRSDLLVEHSSCDSWEELALLWARMLMSDASSAGRACDVVRGLCPRPSKPDWLIGHALDLVLAGCFYPTLRLVRSMGSVVGRGVSVRAHVTALEAVCRQILGDEEGAVRCAKRFAFDETAPFAARVCCLLELVQFGLDTQRERASDCLAAFNGALDSTDAGQPTLWESLVHLWGLSQTGVVGFAQGWDDAREQGVDAVALSLSASWLFAMVAQGLEAGTLTTGELGANAPVERFVRSMLDAARPGEADYALASAALSMENAHMKGMPYVGGPLPTGVLLELRHAELAIMAQRREFENDAEAEKAKAVNWAETHPDAVTDVGADLHSAHAHRNIPVLSVKLFGGFDVSIGGVPVDQKFFHRQNVRSLLVLLVINQGRELSRDAVARAMWPDSEERIARRNFYSVWSQLRLALMLPDGTCPYLIRHQYGCSLENRHVQSDIARFKELCRELLFGSPDLRVWPGLYEEIERDFAHDLMPSEPSNPLIVNARNEYRARLVDALVAASQSVVEMGNSQWGIWFARFAVERDRLREDAYLALMKAQIAANQRTAAMQTYLECQRVLAEELGIDPSPEAQQLYQELIGGM